MKKFNTTGVCILSKHYIVDISERIKKIKKMMDAGKYFTIGDIMEMVRAKMIRENHTEKGQEWGIVWESI